MLKSNYNFFFHYGMLVLQDNSANDPNARSLTNNMENVLLDLERILKIDLKGRNIIYRDSDGFYDGVEWDGEGIKFKPIRAITFENAVKYYDNSR